MSILPGVLKSLFHPPDGDLPADADSRDDFWHNWGFTIYRTAYGGEQSDRHWQALLDKIRAEAEEETRRYGTDEAARAAGGRLRALFRLDARSDAARLDGASDDRLRELYKAGEPGADGKPPVMHAAPPRRRHFLVADARVLEDAGAGRRFWARCVQADYAPEDYASRNPRVFVGQYFFGWMQMTTRSILDLWSDLYLRDLEQIAPRSSDPERRDAALYDGE